MGAVTFQYDIVLEMADMELENYEPETRTVDLWKEICDEALRKLRLFIHYCPDEWEKIQSDYHGLDKEHKVGWLVLIESVAIHIYVWYNELGYLM